MFERVDYIIKNDRIALRQNMPARQRLHVVAAISQIGYCGNAVYPIGFDRLAIYCCGDWFKVCAVRNIDSATDPLPIL